ncbi:Cysteine-rich receptor-like protein kinase 42 [Abeliophyllum distichum]|uniref:Cysteine-rich receptor-like protein kinase 42 n=1 Tax=Abeliophyllum distichum TaxID=126358 RepID=A0ABD1RW23_9LAMI
MPEIFGLAQCHKDLSPKDCKVCFVEAKKKLDGCLPAIGGLIYLEGCFVRYEQYNFWGESVEKVEKLDNKCGNPTDITRDKYMKADFTSKVNEAVMNVTLTAASNEGFGATEVKQGLISVYAIGQCWNTLDAQTCTLCLNEAGVEIDMCLPGAEGQVLNAGCYLRYSTHNFFVNGTATTLDNDGGNAESTLPIVLIPVSVLLALFSALGAYLGYVRYSKRKHDCKKVVGMPSSFQASELNFKYEMLEKATDLFHPSNKLGEGGAGTVYKGTLPNGTVVAVKRLFFNTRQWADEFFNEVNSISGIQHKNLVRLYGCSIEGPESLLVYEFVPNKNLDQILFDRKIAQPVSWHTRLNIIFGIAEGLAHLHEGCQAKIIHRDIKSSNILLDENLRPKIADFGLARRVNSDKSHISTGVAGTLGYLAPEYLVQGCLTEKADIYSFGVLSIEIACGRKNSVFVNNSVLQSVWENYESKTITRSIDTRLNGDFHEGEASRVLRIGLLCTQMRRLLRPSMSEIVQMLRDDKMVVPKPKQPPFQNSSLLAADDTTKSSGENSLSSNWHSTHDIVSTGSADFASFMSSQSRITQHFNEEM